MPPKHFGVALFKKIFGLLAEWGIKAKFFGLNLEMLL